jgi:hypothetical protein
VVTASNSQINKYNIMKRTLTVMAIIVAALVAFGFTGLNDSTAPAKWEKLGSKKVNYGLDRDVIRVSASEGGFSKMKIFVTGGSLNMHRLVVQYGNGVKDKIPLKHTFQKRSQSRVIDLQGRKRIIRDVTIWYDTKNRSRKRATIHIFGRR